jgi:hypothetical protein
MSITIQWLEEIHDVNGNKTSSNLYDSELDKSTLDFGAVQAGKTTKVKCITAQFTAAEVAHTVTDMIFWLDGRTAVNGGQNIVLSGADGWNFYYAVADNALVSTLGFNLYSQSFTEDQKTGATVNNVIQYLDMTNSRYKMAAIPESEETGVIFDLTVYPEPNVPAVSKAVLLSVKTDAEANSGNTEGWYYRMSFLYS